MQIGDKVIVSYVGKCDQALGIEKVREAFVVDQLEADLWELKGYRVSGHFTTDGRDAFLGSKRLLVVGVSTSQSKRCCNVHNRFLQVVKAGSMPFSQCPVNGCTVGLWNAEVSKSLPADDATRQARRDVFELLKQNAHNKISVQTILDRVPFLNGDIKNMKIGSLNTYECQQVVDALIPKPAADSVQWWQADKIGEQIQHLSKLGLGRLTRQKVSEQKVIETGLPAVREDPVREIDLD